MAGGNEVSEPIQIIPALTILEDGGEFTVRVGDAKWAASLGRDIVKMIGDLGVATKLTIVTPSDVKQFKFDLPKKVVAQAAEKSYPPPPPIRPSQRISQDSSAPPAVELVSEYE